MEKSKKYYIGIDGGGTKLNAVLTDENLNVISKKIGGPGNFLIIGVEKVAQSISDLIVELLEESGLSIEQVKAVSVGLTGAGREDDAQRMKQGLESFWNNKYNTSINHIFVNSDARIALEGAFAGKPGSILIAGTGSIMFGKDAKGNIHRVGGMGRFIGDEGSGYSIGRKGLAAIAKFYDGRDEFTILVDKVRDKFGFDSNQTIINAVYKNNFDIASVASVLIETAAEGDKICQKIVHEEIDELILHLKAMYKLLNEEVMKVALIGGISSTDNYLARNFIKKVNENLPYVKIVKQEYPPEIGAIIFVKSNK